MLSRHDTQTTFSHTIQSAYNILLNRIHSLAHRIGEFQDLAVRGECPQDISERLEIYREHVAEIRLLRNEVERLRYDYDLSSHDYCILMNEISTISARNFNLARTWESASDL